MRNIISRIVKGVGTIGEWVLVTAVMIVSGVTIMIISIAVAIMSLIEGRTPWTEVKKVFKHFRKGIEAILLSQKGEES